MAWTKLHPSNVIMRPGY